MTSSSPCAYCLRSTFLSNFPTLVFGTVAMTVQRSGSCHLAIWPSSARKARRVSKVGGGALLEDDRGQGALAPLLVGDGDDGRLGDVRVGHQRVLQLHRRDPLAAGLDDVLGAVGEGQEAVGGDGADVARLEPAVLAELVVGTQRFGVRAVVVGAGDPGAAHLQLTGRLAVPGEAFAAGAGQAGLDAGRETALGEAVGELLRRADRAGRRTGDRAERGRLRHAPGVADPHAQRVEGLHQRRADRPSRRW